MAGISYAVSALAGLACLLLLAAGLRRWRRAPEAYEPPPVLPARDADGWPAAGAFAVSLLCGAAFGFVFGLEAGALSIVVLAVILWRGIGPAALTLAAGVLLGVVVPVLYLVHPGDESGGNHYPYATQHIAAHWVGVAALGLLMVALWRVLGGVGPVVLRPRPPRPARKPPAPLRRG